MGLGWKSCGGEEWGGYGGRVWWGVGWVGMECCGGEVEVGSER